MNPVQDFLLLLLLRLQQVMGSSAEALFSLFILFLEPTVITFWELGWLPNGVCLTLFNPKLCLKMVV